MRILAGVFAGLLAAGCVDSETSPGDLGPSDPRDLSGVPPDADLAVPQTEHWEYGRDGVNGVVMAMAAHDSEIYLGGWFTRFGVQAVSLNVLGFDAVTRKVHTLGAGLGGAEDGTPPPDRRGGPVRALLTRDDGTLYAGGSFKRSGSTPLGSVARWDGSTWQPLGPGLTFHGDRSNPDGTPMIDDAEVDALGLYQGKLVVGGQFIAAGSLGVNNLAVWDGSSWSALGLGDNNGVDGMVMAISGTDDGWLFVCGPFTHAAGGVVTDYAAAWKGSRWFPLVGGQPGLGGLCSSIQGSGDDGGPLQVTVQHGTTARTWTRDKGWSALATSGWGGQLAVDGGVYTWTAGQTSLSDHNWLKIAGPTSGPGPFQQIGLYQVSTIVGFARVGTELFVAGSADHDHDSYTELPYNGIFAVDLPSHLTYGIGGVPGGDFSHLKPLGAGVVALGTVWDTGAAPARHVIVWEPAGGWKAVGFPCPPRSTPELTACDNLTAVPNDGSWYVTDVSAFGADVYVSINANPYPERLLFHWNGSAWESLPTPTGDTQWSTQSLSAEAGGVAIAGHKLLQGQPDPSNAPIYYWDKSARSWSSLAGTSGPLFRDGDGALVVNHLDPAGGVTPSYLLERRVGQAWQAWGGKLDGEVRALATRGSETYIGGSFANIGFEFVNHVARWDGSAWVAPGSGLTEGLSREVVGSMTIGRHGELFVVGDFKKAGEVTVEYGLARWNGSRWSEWKIPAPDAFQDRAYPGIIVGTDYGIFATSAFSIARFIEP